MTTDVRQPSLSEDELCPPELLDGQEAAYARDVSRLLARSVDFVAVPCPACGGHEGSVALEKLGFRWTECAQCSCRYMTPRPSESVMAEHYEHSENFTYWAEHIFPASESARREKICRPWLDRIAGFCDRFDVGKGTLLEVGAGFGTFAALASTSGVFERVIAVEPVPGLAAACRDRSVEVIEATIEDAAQQLSPADVVVAFEVVEHLFDPGQFIRDCARLVRPGGLVVLSTPNAEGFDMAALGAASLAVGPHHVNLFTLRSLQGLLEMSGFEVVAATTPGRLDAEFVRSAALEGTFDLTDQPLLQRVLIDDWDALGGPFQEFLAANNLSSHMWLAARRV
jgi:2-polyprenyl-3-methyl-5-hydroxy-6-metoxy-1,4-benzoquinol methylase